MGIDSERQLPPKEAVEHVSKSIAQEFPDFEITIDFDGDIDDGNGMGSVGLDVKSQTAFDRRESYDPICDKLEQKLQALGFELGEHTGYGGTEFDNVGEEETEKNRVTEQADRWYIESAK